MPRLSASNLLETEQAPVVEAAICRADKDLHTPAPCDVEVASILRRALGGDLVSVDRATDAVIDLLDLPLTRHGLLALLGRILELRHNFSAYDAAYVALAEHLGGELLTADSGLVRAVWEHSGISVIDASGAASDSRSE